MTALTQKHTAPKHTAQPMVVDFDKAAIDERGGLLLSCGQQK